MKERPILFNTEMVKAILNGNKTQSRRPIKPIHKEACGFNVNFNYKNEVVSVTDFDENESSYDNDTRCPFGQIGDHLYVREKFRTFSKDECGCDNDCACFFHDGDILYYASIGEQEGVNWKPSIHMPKKYARIWLEITDIRVEKVQDISEKDAQKEGFRYEGWRPSYNDPDSGGDGEEVFPTENFCKTWEKIYGKENLWVWVIEFKVIKRGNHE